MTQRSVDAAIEMLNALTEYNGVGASARLREDTGIPRSTLYRVAQSLGDTGLVERRHGRLMLGDYGAALMRGHRQRLLREDANRRQPPTARTPEGTPQPAALELAAPVQAWQRRRLRIGFSNAELANPWRTALVHSVEQGAAGLADRIQWLTVRNAQSDPVAQARDIADLVAAGADGIVVSPLAGERTRDAVARATDRGVAVVLVDRFPEGDCPHVSFVAGDDAMIGRVTALWLAEQLRGVGEIVLLPGDAKATPAQRRLRAARAVLARYPHVRVLGEAWTSWQAEDAHAYVTQMLKRHGNRIAGVWADSGLQGAGSLRAFIDVGYRAGTIPPHTGGDLNLTYKLAIRHRVRLAAADYPPAMGRRAVELLCATLSGEWIPREVCVPSDVIITRGAETPSVSATLWAEDHARWDRPDELIHETGLGSAYSPRSFRVHYPGNRYNRSAASR